MILHRAFHVTQQYPDAVISAHAHLYQRITYTLGGGRQIPYIIAGSGGHGHGRPAGLDYVHGYSAEEGTRLADQATALTGLLHDGTRYPAGSLVLEAGGDSLIGRRLYPLVAGAGYQDVTVSPRVVYVDATK